MNEDKKFYSGGEQMPNVEIKIDGVNYVGQGRNWKKMLDIDLQTRKEHNRQGQKAEAYEEVVDPAVIDQLEENQLEEKWNSLFGPAESEDAN